MNFNVKIFHNELKRSGENGKENNGNSSHYSNRRTSTRKCRFYAGVLGLRLVKQTVNFDDPGTYHLYFGNEAGKPGTIITFSHGQVLVKELLVTVK